MTDNKAKIFNDFMVILYRELEGRYVSNDTLGRPNDYVIRILEEFKKNNNLKETSDEDLYKLQMSIEDLINQFDESNIFKETPNLIKLLIGEDLINAKIYLQKNISQELYNSTIAHFGPYTIEAIIIYVLGLLFNSIQESSIVRVSTLLDMLDKTVRAQANIIINRTRTKSKKDVTTPINKKEKDFQIGQILLEFMIERDLIRIESLSADNIAVVKEKGKGYLKSNLFAVCNFDLSILPLKFNLPMVCPPINWIYPEDEKLDEYKHKPRMLSNLRGGYLSRPTLDIYNKVGLLSSNNPSNFNIELNEKYQEMCYMLNGLQKQGFQVNKKVLEFINRNRKTLEDVGLLMPGILARVNLSEAFDLIRILYYQNEAIKDTCSLDDLLKELAIRAQKARYEDFLIRLVSAYEDYVFYLPAFMDFRGRIYRSGILHFHERDLARGLIVFANYQEKEGSKQSAKDIVETAAAFKYQKFNSYDDALQWYKDKESLFSASDESLINFAKDASDPFQFIAKVLCNDGVPESNSIPITQDASASAYQIMSYLLLNEEMAMRTNLLPSPDGKIQDVYTSMLQDLKEFMHSKINDKLKMEIIESKLDRKLVKRLFMPMVYGKTVISMINDIKQTYGPLLSLKDSQNLAKLCYQFWIHKYPDIANLMKLITLISWFSSAMDRNIVYSTPLFTTKQDSMSFVKEQITIYERKTRKRRRVTLSVPTTKSNISKRKTQTSTFANFIHQKDAFIAMKVVNSLLGYGAKIYTVHDNFITTPPYARLVPRIYTDVFHKMDHPLMIINQFIRINLLESYKSKCVDIYHQNPYPYDIGELEVLLNSLSPIKEKTKYRMKVKEFLKCYKNFVEDVSDIQEEKDSELFYEHKYAMKWYNFRELLVEHRSTNFSVHY